MAFYLVSAEPKRDRLGALRDRLQQGAFRDLHPFGPTISHSLRHARLCSDGRAVWEEEDYCTPPLAQERKAVLDDYFDDLHVEPVAEGKAWQRIRDLPPLFPELAGTVVKK